MSEPLTNRTSADPSTPRQARVAALHTFSNWAKDPDSAVLAVVQNGPVLEVAVLPTMLGAAPVLVFQSLTAPTKTLPEPQHIAPGLTGIEAVSEMLLSLLWTRPLLAFQPEFVGRKLQTALDESRCVSDFPSLGDVQVLYETVEGVQTGDGRRRVFSLAEACAREGVSDSLDLRTAFGVATATVRLIQAVGRLYETCH